MDLLLFRDTMWAEEIILVKLTISRAGWMTRLQQDFLGSVHVSHGDLSRIFSSMGHPCCSLLSFFFSFTCCDGKVSRYLNGYSCQCQFLLPFLKNLLLLFIDDYLFFSFDITSFDQTGHAPTLP